MRRLKQQHQNEVAELKARIEHAEDVERYWKVNSQTVLLVKEQELRLVNAKLHDASQEIGHLQVSAHILPLGQPLPAAMV